MKYLMVFVWMVLLTTIASAQFSIRPQLGYNSSSFTDNFSDISIDKDGGFQFGIDVQIGKQFYVQPGLFWESANNSLRDMLNQNTSSFNVDRIKVPLLFGYRLLGPEVAGLVDARIFTGPHASFVVDRNIKEESLLKKNDFQDAVYGWNVGVGLDLAILFVDAGYSFGLSKVFKNLEPDARNNMFYANVGLRLGF
jgi:hypothetical protein